MTLRANEPTAPTQRDKWYVIWDILFPGQEPPPNPYAPVSEVAYAISCYISQYIEQENLQLRRTAREMVRGVTNDLSIATEERAVLERLDQFAQAGEQRRERSGRRNQPSLTTLPTTPSQPSDTPSLVGTMGSSQHTFTNQTGSARTPGHGSDFAVPRPPPRPTGFNGAVAQDRPMVPQFPRAAAAVQSVPSTAANPTPNLGPNATEERVNTAYPQALPALWNPTLAPSLALGPDFDFALFFPEDSKNVSNQFGYGPQ
ncbi:hypothetical protein GQ53DRAFT_743113 [Thozetella sp. PMI_491]|nr:hypothetical protein GQ53DRAFT_743113 [Thozetella sp. PMI_491]